MPTIDSNPAIKLNEFAARRQRVLSALKGATAVVLAGEGSPPLSGFWRPNQHFFYLTGLDSESGAAIVFDPQAEDPRRQCILFLRPVNSEAERWDGYRPQIGPDLKKATGFETVMRSGSLPATLTAAARRTRRLACLHPFSVYPAPPSPDLAIFDEIRRRAPGVSVEDRTSLLPMFRSIKSAAELQLMRRAIAATAEGYTVAMGMIHPGVSEKSIADAMESEYRLHGAQGVAYNSIVGAGFNGTVLHYMENSSLAGQDDLIVIDSGASFGGYAADVTRTFPASGKFSSEQRDIYEVVLKSQLAAIKAIRPGVKMSAVDDAARKVIDQAGFGAAFIHGIGHQLGLEVHDVNPDGPLAPGMVVTIEPGVYFPEKKLGIRIEDDLLVTRKGSENLTAMIPRTIQAVEAAMKNKSVPNRAK